MAKYFTNSDGIIEMIDPPNVYHLVVPNAAGDALLVDAQDDDAVYLPKIVARKDVPDSPWVNHWNSETDDLWFLIDDLMQSKEVYVRRMLWYHYHLDKKTFEKFDTVVVVADLVHQPQQLPARMQWVKFEDLAGKPWGAVHELCDLRAVMDKFCSEEIAESKRNGSIVCPARPPWRKRGWLDSHLKWEEQSLEKHNMKLTVVVQLRNMHRSSVLICNVTCEDGTSIRVYSKTALEMYREGEVTNLIARLLPEFVPSIIEASPNSFIQHEAKELNGYPEPFNFMRTLAEMHMQSIEHVPRLVVLLTLGRDQLALYSREAVHS